MRWHGASIHFVKFQNLIKAYFRKLRYLPFDFLAKKVAAEIKNPTKMETRNVQNLANSGDQSPGRSAAPVSLSPTSYLLPIADD